MIATGQIVLSKVRLLLDHSCAILISFTIVVLFNNTSADFVLISVDVLLKSTTILKEMRIAQLWSKSERTLGKFWKLLKSIKSRIACSTVFALQSGWIIKYLHMCFVCLFFSLSSLCLIEQIFGRCVCQMHLLFVMIINSIIRAKKKHLLCNTIFPK